MRAVLAFLQLLRLPFLYGGFAGVALGAALAARAGFPLDVPRLALAQAMVTCFQLMVHCANDHFDREGDMAAVRTAWSGGSGVLTAGLLPAHAALLAAFVFAAGGCGAVLALGASGRPLAAGIGGAIAVLAWCYSAPPVRFAARGLGELDTAVVVAILVPLASYAAVAGRIDGGAVGALAAPALAMFGMMLAVEVPDVACDAASGKRTLAVRLGARRTTLAAPVTSAVAACAALSQAFAADGLTGTACILPAAALCGLVLGRGARATPAQTAFAGVAVYAATVTGLAVVYGLAAAHHT